MVKSKRTSHPYKVDISYQKADISIILPWLTEHEVAITRLLLGKELQSVPERRGFKKTAVLEITKGDSIQFYFDDRNFALLFKLRFA